MKSIRYYSGEKVAPTMTILIGGNHEASNYLQELPYGGWIAPKIYYMGYANVVNYRGLRIGGLSGIYHRNNYFKGHFEFSPYDYSSGRTVYHYRQQEFLRLEQIKEPIDIMMSHAWPSDVYFYGDTTQLKRDNPKFCDDINKGTLGCPQLFNVLEFLKPKFWFAAHMHCKFSAAIPHANGSETKFLALNRCLPGNQFLQIIDVDESAEKENHNEDLQYDLEWLTILKTTKQLTTTNSKDRDLSLEMNNNIFFRNPHMRTIKKEFIFRNFGGNMDIPRNFVHTALPYQDGDADQLIEQPFPVENPQTVRFCQKLGIDDPLNLLNCFFK